MKKGWLLLAAFLAGFGVIIGYRMSAEATGVVVGVVLGVAASVPMSLLIMMFVTRRERRTEERKNQQPYPPVVIVTPGGSQPQQQRMPYLPPATYGDPQRSFTIVGDDESVGVHAGSRGEFIL